MPTEYKFIQIWKPVNSLASGCCWGFLKKKRRNTYDFLWEFLCSCTGYRHGWSVKRCKKDNLACFEAMLCRLTSFPQAAVLPPGWTNVLFFATTSHLRLRTWAEDDAISAIPPLLCISGYLYTVTFMAWNDAYTQAVRNFSHVLHF